MHSTARLGQTVIPAARYEDLVVTHSGDEVLVYDTRQQHIHHLNATSAAVWKLCDGHRTEDAIARELERSLGERVDHELVRTALTKLADAHLLDGPLPVEVQATRLSRRALLRRSAVAGAVAVPMIVSTTAPTAASHSSSSTCGHTCTDNAAGDTLCVSIASTPCPYCSSGQCASNRCGSPCNTSGGTNRRLCPTDDPRGCTFCRLTSGQNGVCEPPAPALNRQQAVATEVTLEPTATEEPPTEVPPTEVPPTQAPPDPTQAPPEPTVEVVQQSIQQEVPVEQQDGPAEEPTAVPAG